MISKKVNVMAPKGLQVREAGMFSKAAESFQSKVEVHFGMHMINGKSILNILSAAVPPGAELEICCEGKDEKEALERLCRLVTDEMKQ